jgi:hypothetical protein
MQFPSVLGPVAAAVCGHGALKFSLDPDRRGFHGMPRRQRLQMKKPFGYDHPKGCTQFPWPSMDRPFRL